MLMISSPETTGQTVTLRLAGQLIGPWVEELRHASEKFLGNGHRVFLDLTEVTYADPAGVALLRGLQARAITLTGCSLFVAEQLKPPGGV